MKTKLKSIFYIIVVLILFTSSLILDIHAQPKKNGQPEERKLTICHYPKGNNENVQEIEINENSLDTHLEHGDYIKKENEACKPKVIPTPAPIPTTPEPINQPVPELVNPEPTNSPPYEPTNLLTGELTQPLANEPIDEGIYSTAKPVFRFFNILGVPRHFYTINVGEYNDILKLTNEWRYEGIAYYAWTDITDINTKQITCFNGKVPIYRFFSSARANHIYTISISERDTLLNDSTYVYEGIKFCVYPSDSKDGIDPVFRFWHEINDKHFYTINEGEANELEEDYENGLNNWREEGVKFYAIKALNYYNYKFDPSDITNNDKKIGESDFMCGGYKYVIYQNSSQKIQLEDYVFNPAVGSFFSIAVEHYFTAAYYEIGDHCSLLGLPIMNKATAATSPQGTNGEYQMYDKGGIYYNFKYDSTFAVFGKIFEIYEEDSGGTGGTYGFPIDGVRWYGEYNSLCQLFEGGLICEDENTEPEPIDLDADGLDDNLENELMYRYAPVIYLDKDEKYLPASVEWLYGKATLNVYNDECNTNFGTFNSEDNLIGKSEDFKDLNFDYIKKYGSICMKTEDIDGIEKKLSSTSQDNYDEYHYFYLDIYNNSLKGTEDMNQWATYSRVYPNIYEGINIHYWYFFPNNDPSITPLGSEHEGDWEHITVELDNKYNPTFISYAHHEDITYYDWNDSIIRKTDGHPFVYIADGTHASFPDPSLIELPRETSFQKGKEFKSWIDGNLVNTGELSSYGSPFMKFIDYGGRWGATRPRGVVGGNFPGDVFSPFTMSYQDAWNYY
jgi:hypothetical protein